MLPKSPSRAQRANRAREPVADRPDDPAGELTFLRQQVDDLRNSVQIRDDFIAIAAHELRNPMTPIAGVAELALSAARKAGESCPPRVTMLLERMQVLVQEYTKRATRLLDVSRLEAGNWHLAPASTDLSRLVRSVSRRYALAASHQGCSFQHELQDAVTGMVDPIGVEQIVENLISNALKFGTGQPVTVRLRARFGTARLQVEDRGIGMTADQQERIFARFEQVVSHHRGGGFGVGLWVANRLATAMGGRITVSSRLGEGSTFTVLLPLLPPGMDQTAHDAA